MYALEVHAKARGLTAQGAASSRCPNALPAPCRGAAWLRSLHFVSEDRVSTLHGGTAAVHPLNPPSPAPPLSAAHRRRLHAMWRSAGWPCHDALELDLLAAGLLERVWDPAGRETLRVTDAGLQVLAASRRRSQAALGAHEALVAVVARAMQRAGRIVWRQLALRAPLEDADGRTRWVMAKPDVFSIRHTTVEAYLEPVVHEIKVSRADLLADLKRPDKGGAYRALGGECWYVVREGLCTEDEVPADFGLMVACGPGADRLEVLRPAPRRPMRLGFPVWMALARATAEAGVDDDKQPGLTAADGHT